VTFRVRTFVASVLVLWSAQVGASAAQQPPRDSGSIPARGTALIRGRIVAADTGKPLRRASVTLFAPELGSERRTSSTDEDGRYEFTDLPAGRFTLRVSRGGYLQLAYGQHRPREAAKPLQLRDAEVLEHVDLALPRMAIISGRVLDDAGDPMEGVNVHAARSMFRDGQRRLVPVGRPQNRTDDDGEFRLTSLAPGTYYVVAETRETWTVSRGGAKIVLGYAPTYFPGTTQSSEARRLTVQVGQRINNVDFTMIVGRAARLTGTAADSHGKPFRTVVVSREERGEDFGSFGTVASTTVRPDGSFAIDNVPPGEYTIGASSGRDVPEPEVAIADLIVDGTDIDNIGLMGSAGGTLNGRVLTDDGVVPDLPQLRVSVSERISGQRSPMVIGTFGSQRAPIDADGSFIVKGVFGRSWLSVNLPDGWIVKRITHDGHDLTGQPFDMKSGDSLSGVEVMVTDKVTTVSGQLQDDKGVPIKGLPPGDFLAVAVDFVEDGQWNDPEFLESIRRYSVKVALVEAASATVTLSDRLSEVSEFLEQPLRNLG
jgi:hypothetical protein